MANTIMANSPRQLSTDDAAFLLEVLHHLDAPIAVKIRQIASSRNATSNSIHQRIFKIRRRYGINIQSGSGRTRESPKSHRTRNVEPDASPESDLPEFDEILRRAIAAPPTPEGVIRSTASSTAEGSPRKGRRSIGSARSRRTKKIAACPESTHQPEPDQISHMMGLTADGTGMYVSDLNQLGD